MLKSTFNEVVKMAETISYRQQREILQETYAEIGTKVKLLLSTGQLLMENGADTNRIIRDMKRVAAYMGIGEEKFNLHIMYTTLMLNISDETHSYTNFRKCRKHAVDMRIISSVSKLTWRAMRDHYTLEEFEDNLKNIERRPRFYPEWLTILATGFACGGFCALFGCDMAAFFYTAVCAIIGKVTQINCARIGINNYVIVAFAAFSATTAAYFAHFLPTTTPWHPIIASSLFLVPGIPLINSISDLINTMLMSGVARSVHTLLIVGGMTFGIVFAISMFNVEAFTELHMIPDNDYFIFATAAAIGAIGFSILFNLPPRLLIATAIGGIIAVCSRNYCIFELHQSAVAGTFIGATFVSIIGVYAVHWLHAPTQVLTVPSVIPMVPGVLIYRLLFAIINVRDLSTNELLRAIQSGVDAALIILGIAIGVAMPSIFAHRAFERRKREEQERLLKEEYETDD